MSELRYGFERRLEGISFEQALQKVTAALKNEGFGVLTEIDVKETLKKKLNADFRRYVILGACNPPLAHQALSSEPQIGLLLPCNVVVQEASNEGEVIVSIADPRAMFTLVDNPAVKPMAEEADKRLRKVMASLRRRQQGGTHMETKSETQTQRRPFHIPWMLGFCLFAAVALFFLWEEHKAHILGGLPYVLLLLCPIIHLFMHRGHGRHGSEHEGGVHRYEGGRP